MIMNIEQRKIQINLKLSLTCNIYQFITNEDEPLLFCLTPIFRLHLVVFFRVTKNTVNVLPFGSFF